MLRKWGNKRKESPLPPLLRILNFKNCSSFLELKLSKYPYVIYLGFLKLGLGKVCQTILYRALYGYKGSNFWDCHTGFVKTT